MTTVRWGVISTGRMADWFCSDFPSVANGALYGVASRSRERAEAFAQTHNIHRAYDTPEDMLADPDIDVIYIATPHTAHKAGVLNALAAGKHVVCEKPIVTNQADALEVTQAAAHHQRYLMEAMWTWHLPAMQRAKAWVDEGRIGRIISIRADFGYPVPYEPGRREYDPNDAGGVMREMGVYPVAIARFFDRRDPPRIATSSQPAPNGVEANVTALLDFADSTTTLNASMSARLSNTAHIVGTDGYIVIPDAFRCDRAQLFVIDDLVDEVIIPRTERGYHYQAIAVGEDLAAGRMQSPIVPHDASIAFQRDMDAILKSIADGGAWTAP